MKSVAFSLGLAVFCIGLSTCIGYALGWTSLYRWNTGIGMAFNTGIALVFTGAAITILSSRTACFYTTDKKE